MKNRTILIATIIIATVIAAIVYIATHAQQNNAKSIILISIDTLCADSLGCYDPLDARGWNVKIGASVK